MVKSAPLTHIGRARVVRRIPEILRLCTGKKVLHLGCADAPYTIQRGEGLLHKQLAGVTDKDLLWGVDVSKEGVHLLRAMGFEHVLHSNVERLGRMLSREIFDIVLAGEIIEHAANPSKFLQNICSLMSEGTELVLTTVNAFSFKSFLHSLLQREKVHSDHNYYFSYMTIRQLLAKCGLDCREVYYYQEVEGRGLPRLYDACIGQVTKLSPIWADGLIVRAVRQARDGGVSRLNVAERVSLRKVGYEKESIGR